MGGKPAPPRPRRPAVSSAAASCSTVDPPLARRSLEQAVAALAAIASRRGQSIASGSNSAGVERRCTRSRLAWPTWRWPTSTTGACSQRPMHGAATILTRARATILRLPASAPCSAVGPGELTGQRIADADRQRGRRRLAVVARSRSGRRSSPSRRPPPSAGASSWPAPAGGGPRDGRTGPAARAGARSAGRGQANAPPGDQPVRPGPRGPARPRG